MGLALRPIPMGQGPGPWIPAPMGLVLRPCPMGQGPGPWIPAPMGLALRPGPYGPGPKARALWAWKIPNMTIFEKMVFQKLAFPEN